jgi:hypothetical protein
MNETVIMYFTKRGSMDLYVSNELMTYSEAVESKEPSVHLCGYMEDVQQQDHREPNP